MNPFDQPKTTQENISTLAMFMGLPLSLIKVEGTRFPFFRRLPLVVSCGLANLPYQKEHKGFLETVVHGYYQLAGFSALVEGFYLQTARHITFHDPQYARTNQISTIMRNVNVGLNVVPWAVLFITVNTGWGFK